MQSRHNQTGVACCSIDTMSSDSDLVDITSVSVHRQMYDRCATNCLSDELADDYVYDDDDDDNSLLAGSDNNACQVLSTSAIRTDVSDIPTSNGVVDMQSPTSVEKPVVHVAGESLLPPPFGFPLRSQNEIMSRTVELLDAHVKHVPEDCGGNNNSVPHDNAECFRHTANNVCHHDDSDNVVQAVENARTFGNVNGARDSNIEVTKQHSHTAEVITNNGSEAIANSRPDFDDDDTLLLSTSRALTTDNRSISKTSTVLKSGKAASVKTRTKYKQNVASVTNGAVETKNNKTVDVKLHVSHSETNLKAAANLRPANIPSDVGASGDHSEQWPVASGNYGTEPISDAEFIAVVRKKRKDAGARQKIQQSDDRFRKPARPAYFTSPKSTAYQAAGRSSPSHMQPASQKLSSPPTVDFWDSTQSAFPALPSLRVRRSSTGDMPAETESNDDGSDLESVKSMQTSSSWRTSAGRPLGTSSYASVVSSNRSNREPVAADIGQPANSVTQNAAYSDVCLDISPPSCEPLTFEEVTVHALPAEINNVTDRFACSDFMVDSSISHEDGSYTDDSDKQTGSSSLSSCHLAKRHTALFFDTRSKMSSTAVPSLDITFGYDESLASPAVSSGELLVSDEQQTTSLNLHVPRPEQTSAVEFLQRSSVDRPSTTSNTSTASTPRSLFDLGAAQRYLLSAFKEVTETRQSGDRSVLTYGVDLN